MDKKKLYVGAIGFVLGAAMFALLGFMSAPGMMINENISKLSFDETVETIKSTAAEKGWKVPTVHYIDKSVKNAGYDVLPVAVIELCHPEHAGRVIENDDGRVVTSMMPCRVSVYQREDGKVVVSRMNTGMVSKMFGGMVSEVMAEATQDTEAILQTVL